MVRVGAEAVLGVRDASGHVGAGIDVGQVVSLVEAAAGGPDTLLSRLARIVLEEIELGVGAWGGVAVAAMAYGKASATFSLSDKNDIEAGLTVQYEAALGAGAGGRVDVLGGRIRRSPPAGGPDGRTSTHALSTPCVGRCPRRPNPLSG